MEINNESLFRHLIFEYLPYKENKEQNQSSLSSLSMKRENEESLSSSPSDNSVIDKLLGRLPIWPSLPPSSTVCSDDAGLNLLNLLQQQQSSKESSEISQNPVSIVDRLNQAIRQATWNDNSNATNNTDHRIAVQA
jgi:hypothetical protein